MKVVSLDEYKFNRAYPDYEKEIKEWSKQYNAIFNCLKKEFEKEKALKKEKEEREKKDRRKRFWAKVLKPFKWS